jgi:hypothetical protein
MQTQSQVALQRLLTLRDKLTPYQTAQYVKKLDQQMEELRRSMKYREK